jgi:hypothetical protein
LKRKQAALDVEENQNRQFDKKLSQEEAGLGKGSKLEELEMKDGSLHLKK